jgi:hypothetical protein
MLRAFVVCRSGQQLWQDVRRRCSGGDDQGRLRGRVKAQPHDHPACFVPLDRLQPPDPRRFDHRPGGRETSDRQEFDDCRGRALVGDMAGGQPPTDGARRIRHGIGGRWPKRDAHSGNPGCCPRRWPRYPQPIAVAGFNAPLSTMPKKLCAMRNVSDAYTLTLFSCRILYLVFKVPLNRKIRRLRGNTVRLAISGWAKPKLPPQLRAASVCFISSHWSISLREGGVDATTRKPGDLP